jgi:peptidoglycan/xylan/chitin deacetylase (PgdA/CDA1 family)
MSIGNRRAILAAAVLTLLSGASGAHGGPADAGARVPILVYHRFGPTVADRMTVTTDTLESQLRYLADDGYTVIPLRRLIDHRLGKAPPPPARAVVITADDGHRSVYTELYPRVARLRMPVTLFIYPSAISRTDYALTWEQLRELRDSGLFDVQSHSYWHPNFHEEKARLGPAEYERLVATQLEGSRRTLERELDTSVDVLAWPFGIHDAELATMAARAGYVAAVTLEGRPASAADDLMALPRHLVTDRHRGAAFAQLVAPATGPQAPGR